MSDLSNTTLDIDGVETHVVRGGKKGSRTIVFLHGGVPGVTPYAGGSHLFGSTFEDFADTADVIAIDMLGSGLTGYPPGRSLTLDDINKHVLATIAALDLPAFHVIGHDLGGLVALWLGMQPNTRVSSVSVVASAFSSAIGDQWEDLTLASPPEPRFGRASQRWVFDRLSATVEHIDGSLLDAAAKAAAAVGVTRAINAMSTPEARAGFLESQGLVRGKMWAQARDAGYPVPTQIIWGAQDPLATIALGHILFTALAKKQRLTQFHVFNEAGSFVFREQPTRFKRVVTAFLDGLDASKNTASAG
jgi:pimeloyl-ACP methyl ester carboxylesterase